GAWARGRGATLQVAGQIKVVGGAGEASEMPREPQRRSTLDADGLEESGPRSRCRERGKLVAHFRALAGRRRVDRHTSTGMDAEHTVTRRRRADGDTERRVSTGLEDADG